MLGVLFVRAITQLIRCIMSFTIKEKKSMVYEGLVPVCSVADIECYDMTIGSSDYIFSLYDQNQDRFDSLMYIDRYTKDGLDAWYEQLMHYLQAFSVENNVEFDLHQVFGYTQFEKRLEQMVEYYPAKLIYTYLISCVVVQTEVEVDFCDDVDVVLVDDIDLSVINSELPIHKFKNREFQREDLVWDLKGIGDVNFVPCKLDNIKHGQKKLLIAFLNFLTTFPTRPASILFFGAAPGHAIIRASQLLDIRLICVDDYPMCFDDSNIYFSFKQVFNDGVLDDLFYDGVFMDIFQKDQSRNYQYTMFVDWMLKQRVKGEKGFRYSIKRFIPLHGRLKKFSNSKICPMVYTSESTLEVREEGFFLPGDMTIITESGVINSMRVYLLKTRFGYRTGKYRIRCNCYDCEVAEFVLSSVAYNHSVPFSELLQLFADIHCRRYKNVVEVIEESLTDNKGSLLPIGLELISDGNFVWLPDVFDSGKVTKCRESLVFRNDSNLDKVYGPWMPHSNYAKLMNGTHEEFENKWRSIVFSKNLRLDSKDAMEIRENLLSEFVLKYQIERYYRPSLIAKFVDVASGEIIQYVVPKVGVTTLKGREFSYFIAGSSNLLSWQESDFQPNCPVCDFNPDNRMVRLRDFLACFHPVSHFCSNCGVSHTIQYSVSAKAVD